MNESPQPRTFPNWTNKYISLLHTKPEYIYLLPNKELVTTLRAQIDEAIAQYHGNVEIELGSGSGGHLIAQAARSPATLFLGFELRYKRVFRTAEKAEREGVTNLRIIHADATLLSQLFARDSLNGIYVNFPDPWAKPKQRKHRLLQPEYLNLLFQLLKPGGFFSYKTDHHGYFLESKAHIEQIAGITIHRSTEDLYASPYAEGNISTEFEKLFLSQHLPINALYATKG